MSFIRGSATDYLDLSDEIVLAATGDSLLTVDSISGAGTGYALGEIITFTTGTFTIATQLEVIELSGSAVAAVRVYNSGVYTVDPNDSSATTSSGSGTGATFTHTYASNGWTAERDTTYSGSEKEVILNGIGNGAEEIYVGWRTLSGAGYYNFELHGMTGFNTSLPHDEQPGVSDGFHDVTNHEDGCYLMCRNDVVTYWLNITSRRIIIIVRVVNFYFNAYLGFGNRFGTTTELPYPMCIAGHTSTPFDPSNQSKLSSGLTDPWASSLHPIKGPMQILNTDGTWLSVKNGTMSATTRVLSDDMVVIPAQRPGGISDADPADRFMASTATSLPFTQVIPQVATSGATPNNMEVSPGTVGAFVLFPATIVLSDPVIQIPMELDHVYWISAYSTLVTEDRVIIGNDSYRVFQNCNRPDFFGFLAIKET
jgi:hypothetical protein